MKFLLVICIFSLAIIGCDRLKNTRVQHRIKSFDFSYNNFFSACFSVKFTEDDTVFVRQYFSNSDTPEINTNYYAVLSKRDRTALDSIMTQTNYLQFDSLYYQSYEDGTYYEFCFENDSIRKFVHVHSDSVPAPLQTLELWILNTKKRLLLHRTTRTINFPSAKYFALPPPKRVKFELPDVD